jgi:hypothetical protein
MKTLKKLVAAVALMCLLGLSAFASETSTPSCVPGEIQTPPCAMAQGPTAGDTLPGQVETPPAAQSDASFTEIAASVLVGIMSLF